MSEKKILDLLKEAKNTDGDLTVRELVEFLTISPIARMCVRNLVSLRRIVCALDRAAENPDWWRANRLAYFRPDLTHREIGEILGLKREVITRYIDMKVDDACYDSIPREKENW